MWTDKWYNTGNKNTGIKIMRIYSLKRLSRMNEMIFRLVQLTNILFDNGFGFLMRKFN